MEREYARYCVAWVPVPGTALADFGAAWTGCCTVTGEPATVGPVWKNLREAAKVSLYPGGLGLRAPLTVPFTLPDGVSRWAVESMLEEFAAGHSSAHVVPPVVRVIDDQLMFLPAQPDPDLTRMIPELQETLAPMILPERGPAPRRFAMPLSGMVGPTVAGRLKKVLTPYLEGITGDNPRIASISLVGDPGDGQAWRMIHRYPLTGPDHARRDVPDAMAFTGPDLLAPITGTGARRQAEPQAV